jgi:hypothetical protein
MDLCSGSDIEDDLMDELMAKICSRYKSKVNVLSIPINILAHVYAIHANENLSDEVNRQQTQLRTFLQSQDSDYDAFICALHLSTNHWGGVYYDFKSGIATFFDPLGGSDYRKESTKIWKQIIHPVLPSHGRSKTYFYDYVPQDPVDGTSCGIYVLLFFELKMTNTSPTKMPKSKVASYFRFRSLSFLLQA